MWVEIVKMRSRVSKKAHRIAKARCGLPTQKTQGAYLLVHDKDGKQLVGSTDYGFPMCGKDWRVMREKIKALHPKAHTLHLSIAVDSAKGWRDYESGDVVPFTGTASEVVHTFAQAA
ncbi:hypothetical protein AhyVDH1_051 [Aeromonas phage AhyVDH1]|nr:hypothetical protein AhyVDH1_051 [Aeromonas phage AhyVDH1]